jgi:hypothetical protein
MSSSKFEAPRFCPKHLKIHVCEEMDVTKKVKDAEGEIGARVRRLHGTQTEEEMATEAAKQAPAAGSIGAILAAAKNKIAETKKQIPQGPLRQRKHRKWTIIPFSQSIKHKNWFKKLSKKR